MTNREDNKILDKTVLDDSNQETKSCSCLEKSVPNFLLVFVPSFYDSVDYLRLLLKNSSFKNFCQNNCVGRILRCAAG